MKRPAVFTALAALVLCLGLFSYASSQLKAPAALLVPSSQLFITYLPVSAPVKDADPRNARPIGVGSVASGGSTVSLVVSVGDFGGKVDIYIALRAKDIDRDNLYFFTPQNRLQRLSDGLVAWRSDTFANITNEALVPSFDGGSLPLGTYEAFVIVVPSGALKESSTPPFYLWQTAFTIDSKANAEFVVFAWNDLGMHCLNPTYDEAVVLPPYNTIWAQVVRRGNPPTIVTQGLKVEYTVLNNTYSYGKRSYGQFWDNAAKLFGINLERDKGLNLADPGLHNGLSGTMAAKGDRFQVDGIPVTPVDDGGAWNPYQVAVVTVRDSADRIIAQTRATVPTSDEINCGKCHGNNAFSDVLQKHDQQRGTKLLNEKPVLCASCHGSPALGMSGKGSSGRFLSDVIHGFHADKNAACSDCHPGQITRCSRSIAHTSSDGNCIACHGSMKEVSASIATGARIPWVGEPKCATCHGAIAEVDTGATLYRNAAGHGSLYCAACHGSPHAMVPTNQPSDNYQALKYQGRAKSLGSCAACHLSSRGLEGEIGEFSEEHGGINPEKRTACNICHTAVSGNTARWPHAYQWKARL